MTGRYIRQKRDGMRDPTMTHVEDPSVFVVGHLVRDYTGWHIIVDIRESQFGDPMTRFIYLEPARRLRPDIDEMLPSPMLHDLRPYDVENFYHSGIALPDGGPASETLTLEQARTVYEDAWRSGLGKAYSCGDNDG